MGVWVCGMGFGMSRGNEGELCEVAEEAVGGGLDCAGEQLEEGSVVGRFVGES